MVDFLSFSYLDVSVCIYLLESRFSPLMKKGGVAKFCKQQQQQQQKVVNAKPKNHRGIPPTS
jgi:hypothetical protein